MRSRSVHAGAASASDQIAVDELIESAVELASAGDPEAFASIYRAFAQRIYRFCLFRVGRPADAEDLTQVVFLKIIEALPRYERRGLPFSAWVFRVARNAVTDFERARCGDVALDWLTERPDLNQDDAIPQSLGEREVLVRALNGLTRDQREVIAYRFFAGLSTREIGVLLGRREGAIRALQCRALDALRERLGAGER